VAPTHYNGQGQVYEPIGTAPGLPYVSFADLNNHGLLDIVFATDPDNSGLSAGLDRYEDKVYWNTGVHGARENHRLRVRFAGVSDADLIAARPEAGSPTPHSEPLLPRAHVPN